MATNVMIRLARFGTKKKTHFKIIVNSKNRARDGRFIEQLGFYDPSKNPPFIKINKDRAVFWLKSGAVPSQTVSDLFEKEGIKC